jgi:hypothetical protein
VLSSSTGAALIAGVVMSMRRFCVAKAGDVLCENVPLRETGEMGPGSAVVGVEANGVVAAMVAMFGVWWDGLTGPSSREDHASRVYLQSRIVADEEKRRPARNIAQG